MVPAVPAVTNLETGSEAVSSQLAFLGREPRLDI